MAVDINAPIWQIVKASSKPRGCRGNVTFSTHATPLGMDYIASRAYISVNKAD
jgi:hypothetical protein